MNVNNPKIALIGLGYWGKNLARNLYELGALNAICDSSVVHLNKYKELYPDVECYNNIRDLLESDIEALVIATPAATHGNFVKKSLNANKHVFVEKPLCLDVKEGKQLLLLAKEKKLKLMVGHLLLYHPAFIALKELILSGGLGKIRYIYSNRLSLGKLRKEENALWSFAPHDISMILSLLDREPIKIDAFGGSYLTKNIVDTTITFMEFSKGVKAHIYVSWLHPFKEQRLVVVGDKAMATFIDVAEKEKKLLLYKHDVAWNNDIPVVEKAEGIPIAYDTNKEPLRFECESFIEWLKGIKTPPSTGDEGLRVLKVLDKAERKLKEHINDE